MNEPNETHNWQAVIARALAFLCLKQSEAGTGSVLEQATFLEKLGVPLADRATLVGSTTASLRELARQARSRKGTKRGKVTRGR